MLRAVFQKVLAIAENVLLLRLWLIDKFHLSNKYKNQKIPSRAQKNKHLRPQLIMVCYTFMCKNPLIL
ncbi:hypothetical protein BN163_370004 [Clostridioides difficile T5]|nr:hypothetical protein BN163_370004 [Clostridioides difficile T5]